ncbi:MAG: hypothetical protein OEY20_02160 [Gemmatimonadota bacterium]|nr:hypothetical protein [Gemmatimonadota bacterium]MDH5196038.1 hypothetical protein [Gemmatimonadota bacterium]
MKALFVAIFERLLSAPQLDHVYFDLSWDETAAGPREANVITISHEGVEACNT